MHTESLHDLFQNHNGRLVRKWIHYLEVYEKHFERYRGKPITMLEIGVCDGGSLQLWNKYFGDQVKIYGVDLDPRCKAYEEDNIEIFIGNQSDRSFLRHIKASIPKVDILLDDGGHVMEQQIATFEELFDHVKDDGVFMCEDVHTSYWSLYGGGYEREGTFVEYTKKLIDQLNAWHSKEPELEVDGFTKAATSIHFYDSIVAIEKQPVVQPKVHGKGTWKYSNTDLAKVLAIYDDELKDSEDYPLWMAMNYANALSQGKRYKEADGIYANCLKINPSHWSAWLKRADNSSKQGDFANSLRFAEQALTLKKGLIPGLLIASDSHKALGNKESAIKCVKNILDSNPSHKGALNRYRDLTGVMDVA